MIILQKKCYTCGRILDQKIVKLQSQQDGFKITKISREYECGCRQPNEFED